MLDNGVDLEKILGTSSFAAKAVVRQQLETNSLFVKQR